MNGLEITYKILKDNGSKENKNHLIDMLYDVGAIMLKNVTLKSGLISPIYVNLRSLTGQSELFAMMLAEFMTLLDGLEYDLICGVPHGAVQFSHFMSQFLGKNHIFPRDSAKNYGTKNQIDGIYKSGQRVLLVEDVITSGQSIVELVQTLRGHGLIVEDVLVFVDRDQKGSENLQQHGLKLKSVFNLPEIIEFLLSRGKISQNHCKELEDWISKNKTQVDV
ncbi:uncharacterized protein LOC141851260 [Brevipalpus obovatus]|uniref:uncharacterized protein LOC141851260 n=1 Tax=Brevipalpus obovatus TaxID=246614 RepID=UPI003D9F5938